MPTLDRDGVHIYYETHGSGPAILLTHGFSATAAAWKPQVEALSQHYQLITWDMRGHGQSDSPEDPAAYSEALTVGDMTALLEAHGIEQAVVGGHSLGGYLSLAFNVTHPGRVKGRRLRDRAQGGRPYPGRLAHVRWQRQAQRPGVEPLTIPGARSWPPLRRRSRPSAPGTGSPRVFRRIR